MLGFLGFVILFVLGLVIIAVTAQFLEFMYRLFVVVVKKTVKIVQWILEEF